MQVLALEHPAALAVDDLALPVHHVVVLEDVLADLEVLRLDLAPARTAIARVTILVSIGTSSGILSAWSARGRPSRDLNSRIRSSSSDR